MNNHFIFFQHRVAQENILYKDEQLREAHAWVAQVRDMDVLQSQSLQVELRERMEQFNQYWISSQQQVSFFSSKTPFQYSYVLWFPILH